MVDFHLICTTYEVQIKRVRAYPSSERLQRSHDGGGEVEFFHLEQREDVQGGEYKEEKTGWKSFTSRKRRREGRLYRAANMKGFNRLNIH